MFEELFKMIKNNREVVKESGGVRTKMDDSCDVQLLSLTILQ